MSMRSAGTVPFRTSRFGTESMGAVSCCLLLTKHFCQRHLPVSFVLQYLPFPIQACSVSPGQFLLVSKQAIVLLPQSKRLSLVLL